MTRGESDGLLTRQPVSIGSDGVRLPTFSTSSSTLLCHTFSKSLANWHAASPIASCHSNSSPSDPMESGRLPTCISTQSATLYFLSGCSWPLSIGLSLGVLDNLHSFQNRSTSFSVGLPRMVCAFVCETSVWGIILSGDFFTEHCGILYGCIPSF